MLLGKVENNFWRSKLLVVQTNSQDGFRSMVFFGLLGDHIIIVILNAVVEGRNRVLAVQGSTFGGGKGIRLRALFQVGFIYKEILRIYSISRL